MGKRVLPDDFGISEEMRSWANREVPEIDIDRETQRFKDYWRANGKKMADWSACWRNWIRNAVSRGGYRRPLSDVARSSGRMARLADRGRLAGFRGPYPADTPETYETALREHERAQAFNVIPLRRPA